LKIGFTVVLKAEREVFAS